MIVIWSPIIIILHVQGNTATMSCMQSEVEREQKRVDRLINRQLKEDKRSLKHELKLLLLGVLQ